MIKHSLEQRVPDLSQEELAGLVNTLLDLQYEKHV